MTSKAIQLLLAALCLLLSGCATVYDLPFVREPQHTLACVKVHWVEEAKIQNHCAPNAKACATVGDGQNLQQMWATKPAAFDDFWPVYRIGHEFLHNMGGMHK